MVRSTGGHITFIQGCAVVVFMGVRHLRILMYDLKFLDSEKYDGDIMNDEPTKIIIDVAVAISITKCNKHTAGNRHVTRKFHCVRQGKVLK